jgi:phage terminase Nu1 subunit (DNA packaging protein)
MTAHALALLRQAARMLSSDKPKKQTNKVHAVTKLYAPVDSAGNTVVVRIIDVEQLITWYQDDTKVISGEKIVSDYDKNGDCVRQTKERMS